MASDPEFYLCNCCGKWGLWADLSLHPSGGLGCPSCIETEGIHAAISPPRCETCRHWQPAIDVRGKLRGNCREIGITCNLDFGCVQWEAKSDE